MFKYLRDNCALILSGFSLYEGLKLNFGMVAVYGKGDLVHTLHKYENSNTRAHLESLLKQNSDIVVTTPPAGKGPVDWEICVPDNDGIEGLEKYLESLGFSWSQYQNEQSAAKSYVDDLNKRFPEIKINGEFPPERNPSRGREIAAAVSMGHIYLTGSFGSTSNKEINAAYRLCMETPLDMGTLRLKILMDFPAERIGLVYINGSLRVLISQVDQKDSLNRSIWDIYPKLDSSKNYGLLERKELESFLFGVYIHISSHQLYKDKLERVLLRS